MTLSTGSSSSATIITSVISLSTDICESHMYYFHVRLFLTYISLFIYFDREFAKILRGLSAAERALWLICVSSHVGSGSCCNLSANYEIFHFHVS